MSKHENSIDIDGLCCTECAYRGAQAERERIIALLDLNLDCELIGYDYLGFRVHSEHCKACELVALINGENK